MPIALIILGILLTVSAYQGTVNVLGAQVKSDLLTTGSGSGAAQNGGFLIWAGAIVIIGAIGFYKPLATVSRLFLGLVLAVLILANKGLFTQLSAALTTAGAAAAPATGLSQTDATVATQQVQAATTAATATASGSAGATGTATATATIPVSPFDPAYYNSFAL